MRKHICSDSRAIAAARGPREKSPCFASTGTSHGLGNPQAVPAESNDLRDSPVRLDARHEVQEIYASQADWTAKEDRLLRKHYLSLTARQMQERHLTRRTVGAVRMRIRTLGLPRPIRWDPADIALIRRNAPGPGGIAYCHN